MTRVIKKKKRKTQLRKRRRREVSNTECYSFVDKKKKTGGAGEG